MHPLPFSAGPAYAVIFWASYVLWVASEMTASRKKRSLDVTAARDRGSFWLIIISFWIGQSLAFTLSFLLPHFAIPWHRKLLFFLGIGLMLAGIAFRRYAISVLGRFFTVDVAIQADHTIVDVGPYRYIRHPSYTGAIITQLGLALALGNWASLLALFVCVGIAYSYRISVEEAALLAAFGEPYQLYMRRTSRLVPFVF